MVCLAVTTVNNQASMYMDMASYVHEITLLQSIKSYLVKLLSGKETGRIASSYLT